MEAKIYSYSLLVSLVLMIFFGIYFILGRIPSKKEYSSYRISRSIMGVALLTLSVNYLTHLLVQPRFMNPLYAIFMNLSTYYLEAWLFSCALMELLKKDYLTKRLFTLHILSWISYTVIWTLILVILPNRGYLHLSALFGMAVWFVIYSFRLARRLYITYKRAVKAFDDYHSDDIELYIKWMSRFTYWAVVFGVGVGLLTFIPNHYIYLWIISAIPFYIYLFCSYMNYLLFCEQVNEILESGMLWEEEVEKNDAQNGLECPDYFDDISSNLSKWLESRQYTTQGLNVAQVAEALNTNRTYLYEFIKYKYDISFREWINNLRIEYAKQRMVHNPNETVSEIAEKAGYISMSNFSKLFSEAEGTTPFKWRKLHIESMD